MPVYNVEAYIAEAIASVLGQTMSDFELIIVDDGGTDSSIAIARKFDDSRIRIVSQANRGLAGARNSGINAALAPYIAFIDSDDRWHPEKLALHCIHLDNNPEIGVSFAGSRFIDAYGAVMRQAQRPKQEAISASDIFMRNPIGNGSAPVLRRRTLDSVAFLHPKDPSRLCFFDESFRQSEDIEMWLRIALQTGWRFEGVSGLLTDYRVVGGALSANVVRQYDSWERMVSKLRPLDPAFFATYERAARAFQLRYLARRAVQLGDGAMALMLLRNAARQSLRPMWREPVRSLVTVGAAAATALLPSAWSRALARHWTGSGAAA
jgi:glycosyltransferase involved in cell wall biosynthesis